MRIGSSRREGQTISLPRRASWLDNSDILIFLVGILLVLGVALLTIQRDYRSTIALWKSRLSATVIHQAWTLSTSLQQSQDDSQILADFAPTKELLLNSTSTTTTAAHSQVFNLFADYRKVYEYQAICLFDPKKQLLVQASADTAAWSKVAQSSEFSEAFQLAATSASYQVKLVQGFDRTLFLIFAMPILPASHAHSLQKMSGPAMGVVALFDPFSRELLPLLTSKEFTMRTCETVLLQLHGGDPHAIEPRYVSGPAASAQVSPVDTLRSAATHAPNDQALFGQYVDYRGVPVMAAMQKLPSIDSVIILKVNSDEALSDFHHTARLETYSAIAVVFAYAAVILLFKGDRAAREMRAKLTQEHLINERLETIVAQRTKQLAQMNSELETRVQHRTAELEAANKELDAFSYSVSHDLRAPLRGIDGWSQALLEDYGSQLDEAGQQYLNRVVKETQRMGRLIDDMLRLSRLSQEEMNFNPVDLTAMAQRITSALRYTYSKRIMQFVIAPNMLVAGDARLLEIAITNLFNNAVKFTSQRTSALIEFGKVEKLGQTHFYIRDNGAGFDMEYAGNLFGAFQRLHSDSDFPGTGIGLAIVQRVIARHGGRIWAEARVDQGATFWFTLATPKL